MAKLGSIYKKINSLFNFKLAEKWDKSGITFGSMNKQIKKTLICLDVTKEVLDIAIGNQVDLIISHHPFIFEKYKEDEWKKAPWKKEILSRFINTNIAHLSAHTNYDKAKGGMSDEIINYLDVTNVKNIPGTHYGRIFDFVGNIGDIEQLLYNKLELSTFSTNIESSSEVFGKIAIFPGSSSIEDLIKTIKSDAEVVITSDIKWSDQLTADQMGIKIISASHVMERIFIPHMGRIISQSFKDVEVMTIQSKELLK